VVRRILYLSLALALIASSSLSEEQQKPPPPIQIFYDDKALSNAAAEILKMDYNGVKSLANVLALCQEILTENEIIQRDCQAAITNFTIEFGTDGALDDVLFAYNLIAMGIRADERVHQHNPATQRDPEVGKKTIRMSDIADRLRRVTHFRFLRLREQQHESPHGDR
jgi:hypothetical protein